MRREKSLVTAKLQRTRSTTWEFCPWESSDNDHGLIRAQQSDEDISALVVSASLASNNVRLLGPGEPGEIPILAPKKTSNWNTTLKFLGFVINSHTLEISVTPKQHKNTSDKDGTGR